MGALALFAAAYYQSDWVWLRFLTRDSTGALLAWTGHRTERFESGDQMYLAVNGHPFSFTAKCTYADLMLVLAPFVWRYHVSLAGNLLRVAALCAGVFLVNLGRLTLALHWKAAGLPWLAVHDVPDVLLHGLLVIPAVVAALRSDR